MEKLEHELWIVQAVNAAFGPLVRAMLRALGRTPVAGDVIPDYLVMCAVIVVAGAALFVFRTPDEPLPAEHKPRVPLGTVLRRLWVSPRQHPDFGWAWGTHFFVNLGNDLGTLYLLYFLNDRVRYHDPQTGLLTLMGLYAVALLIAGISLVDAALLAAAGHAPAALAAMLGFPMTLLLQRYIPGT